MQYNLASQDPRQAKQLIISFPSCCSLVESLSVVYYLHLKQI